MTLALPQPTSPPAPAHPGNLKKAHIGIPQIPKDLVSGWMDRWFDGTKSSKNFNLYTS